MANVVCTACGYHGPAKRMTKGSFAIELLLWLLFFVPGIIYSIWRLTSRYDGCPACKQATVIPDHTPVARQMLSRAQPD